MTEGRIQDEVRLALSECGVLCWRNNVGVAVAGQHTIRFGLAVGSSDLIGVYRGRFLAIEIKTPVGRQTEEQKRWQKLVEANGGLYKILRSAEEARRWFGSALATL